MKNRTAGAIILLIGLVIGLIIYMFNRALSEIVLTSCSHGTSCPMWGKISFQTNISLVLMLVILGIGIYFVFAPSETKIITKVVKKNTKTKTPKKEYSASMRELNEEEKKVLQKIIGSDGTIFQSNLVEELNYPKAKVTRILDKLEGKGLVERKRRGMTNVVVLKR